MPRRPIAPSAPALYARISLDRTGEGLGVQRQIDECVALCQTLGWPEPAVYKDNDISAASGKRRPGFERLLADIESGKVDGLVAWHLDRLLRRVKDMTRLLDALEASRGVVPVAFVRAGEIDLTTASGRGLAHILAAIAQIESEQKGERVAAKRRQEAHSGRAHGPLGYGYGPDQQIVPEEAEVIRDVAARILAGETLYSIAQDLNARGVPTPSAGLWDSRRVAKTALRNERSEVCALIAAARKIDSVTPAHAARLLNAAGGVTPDGGRWTAAAVRSHLWCSALESSEHGLTDSDIAVMLRDTDVPADPTYWRAANVRAMMRRGSLCGWREHSPGERGGNGVLVAEGSWTPILSRNQVEQIRTLTDPSRGPVARGRKPKYLLAGILKCGKCGSSLAGSPTGAGKYRYACSKQPGAYRCGGLTISGPEVDAIVSRAVLDVLADAKVRAGEKRAARTGPAIVEAEQELLRVSTLRTEYAEEAASGGLSPAEYRVIRDGLTARERAASRILGSWAPSARVALTDVPTRRPALEGWWESASTARRREVIKTLVDHIDVAATEAGKRSNRFNPARIGEPHWLV